MKRHHHQRSRSRDNKNINFYKHSPRRSSRSSSGHKYKYKRLPDVYKRKISPNRYSSSSYSRSENRKKQQRHRYRRVSSSENNYYHRKTHDKKRHTSYSSSSSSSSSSSVSEESFTPFSSSVSSQTRKRRTTPHFRHHRGEKLGHKYKLTRILGTGTFGRVVQGIYDGYTRAIKVIKPVRKYIQSAKVETQIVQTLNRKDLFNKFHIVRFYESFYHHSHYCMVYETLGLSLYEVIKQNRYVGFPMKLFQSFARQIFEAIGFMHECGYTHTDLKPENILLCSQRLVEQERQGKKCLFPTDSSIKIIDFGGATHEKQHHSYTINTRQYRGPQVILQCCNWTHSSDLWSIGCILVQLYTGELLFHTHDNYQHLVMINKLSGDIPFWMVKNAEKQFKYFFDENGKIQICEAKLKIRDWKQINDLKRLQEIFLNYRQLGDLISKCLQINPRIRITCNEALRHPFFDRQY